MALEPHAVLAIALIFFAGGLVKGTVGFGLPTIGIGLGALVLDIPTAMMLIALPTILTNAWQIRINAHPRQLPRHFWVFLLAAFIPIPLGIATLVMVPEFPYERLLGAVILLYSLWSLLITDRTLPWLSRWRWAVLAGGTNAVLTGLTGCFSVPGVMYLRGLGLDKSLLLAAMGLLYLVSALGMWAALAALGQSTVTLGLASLAACVPVGAGVLLGNQLHQRLSEAMFRRIFLWVFASIGVALLVAG
ncbi:MAG: sulfite exporter TauE/SafE family protein [Proteobacteria bacterium]|nr:sulfite exporter TauE/SafE family protein [Pseudomonadota bacterium]